MTSSNTPICPSCRGRDYTTRFLVESHPLLRCRTCGLERLHPQPSDQELTAIYNAEYQLAAGSPAELDILDAMKSMTADLYLNVLGELNLPERPRLLEIGCGWGHFIAKADAAGYDVHGVELSPHAVAEARKRVAPERITNATIEESGLPPASFDVAVLIDVIEHVRAPHSFLETVGAMLKPGGYLFMVMPNTDSLSARLMGSRWVEYKPEHLFSFSRRSLSRLLLANDFEDIRILPARKALNFNFIQAYFERFTVPVLTPLITGLGTMLPHGIRFRQWILPAGGMIGIARKP